MKPIWIKIALETAYCFMLLGLGISMAVASISTPGLSGMMVLAFALTVALLRMAGIAVYQKVWHPEPPPTQQ